MTITPDATDYDGWSKLAPWDKYKSDLILTVHHVLTEPVCPTASVSFEIPERAGVRRLATCCGDSVEEAVHLALQAARGKLEKMANGEDLKDGFPPLTETLRQNCPEVDLSDIPFKGVAKDPSED
ncbi:hypothetical protein [Sulfitobacter sp. R18_1]|uniref:hypothetical protein n=1 Tax=Sulfitobacter sp. R18_1 TaxID=2821104 RepID=UPI001AD99011|nr:hypothetical protein [Sulfitobacter sp. R18_1]MBO9428637.1 hypothetical protein [Sulfitobacter sp. R18_1]